MDWIEIKPYDCMPHQKRFPLIILDNKRKYFAVITSGTNFDTCFPVFKPTHWISVGSLALPKDKDKEVEMD